MFTFNVQTKETPWYVQLNHIYEILREHSREDLCIKFNKGIQNSTVYVYEREPKNKIGIYPWDVAAIFYKLKVDVCFQDEAGNLVNVNKGMSGVSD
jgi:hypothetical protein